LDCRSFGFIIV